MKHQMHRRAFLILGAVLLALSIAASGLTQTNVRPIATLPVNLSSTAQTTGILPKSRGGTGTTTGASSFTPPTGRLTLTSATPITTGDVTGASTIYYTPDSGLYVPVSDGAVCQLVSSAEISIVLSGLTSAKNYDVFAKSVSGTLTLELSAAWSSDTARTDAVARDTICVGLLVKSSDHTRTLVGTFRTTGTTTTEDSAAKRFLWNAHRRTARALSVSEATTSWTYASATFHQANAAATNQFEFVLGAAGQVLDADLRVITTGSSNTEVVGIGIDSTSTDSSSNRQSVDGFANAVFTGAKYVGAPGLGYHKVVWLESVNSGTGTFYGANAARNSLAGMTGVLSP